MNVVLIVSNIFFRQANTSSHVSMRDTMERLVGLPFSIGCVSQSSVDVVEKKPTLNSPSPPPPSGRRQLKNTAFALQRPSTISAGIQKLIKSIKSLSQMFVYKDEDEEVEMEIGLPTDVQHVGHIGWDGFNSVDVMKSWEVQAPEFLTIPSLSLKQFELAMAAQGGGGA